MAEEQMDANQVEAETTVNSSEAENTQDSTVSEDAKTQESGDKDYKRMYEQSVVALKKERERRREQPKVQVNTEVGNQDEVQQRFLRTEANATIAIKLQTDPTFRDRVDIVQEYVARGYDIDMADRLAKGDIMDKILNELPKEVVQNNQPKQLNTQAVPERIEFTETGDHLKDFLNDPNVPEMAKEAARRQF